MQYIRNFLHTAVGFDVSSPNTTSPPSQLALKTKPLMWDPHLVSMGTDRFGGIVQLARYMGQMDVAMPHTNVHNTSAHNTNYTANATATTLPDTNVTPNQTQTNTNETNFSTQQHNANFFSSTKPTCDTHRGAIGSHDDHDNFDGRSYFPQCSTHQTTIETFSFNTKESTNDNSSICGIDHKCFTPTTILRTISTSTFHETAANAIINLQANDEDCAINKIESVDFSTFLQDWEAFHNKFTHLTSYTLAHSSAADLMLLAIDCR